MTGVPTVLIYDPITAVDWSYQPEREALRRRGVELIVPADLTQARAALPNADVVVVSQHISADDLGLLPRGRAVLCYSVGMDGVDAARAAAAGLTLRNVPDYCADEVSDHAVTLLLALFRSLVPIATHTGSGNWEQAYRVLDALRPRRVRDQVAGVVGLGRIGSKVAAKCYGLGMRVLAHDPYVTDGGPASLVDLPTLLARSDAVLLCAALTTGSTHLIDAAALRSMKASSVLVNVARGALIDEAALAKALRSHGLAGAALDVREHEPPDPQRDPFVGLDSVLLTPHMAASSDQAKADLHLRASEIILQLLTEAGRLPTTGKESS